MKSVDITVIMLAYNNDKHIEKALDSILAQKTSYTYEIVVGEDCSPDNCREILKKYEMKYPNIFRMFYREKNLGATRNAYELYMDARGRYIAPIEADDYWIDVNKLEKQVSFLEEHGEYFGVGSDYITVDENGNIINDNNIKLEFINRKFTWNDFLKFGFVFQSATMIYRNFYHDGGDYTIFYKAHDLVGDLTGMIIMLNKGDFFIMNEKTSVYRMNLNPNGNNATAIGRRDLGMSLIKMCRQCSMLKTYVKNDKDLNELIIRAKARFIFQGIIKRNKTITFERWKEIRKYGDYYTNIYPLFSIIKNWINYKCGRQK